MLYPDYEIVDFHIHPFIDEKNNICSHKNYMNMNVDETKRLFSNFGVTHVCGSVLTDKSKRSATSNIWEYLVEENNTALKIRDYYGDFYLLGFHVHPDYVKESIDEIHRMHSLGVHLIGELCPYLHGWNDYSCESFSKILDEAEKYNMIVSFHSSGEDEMDKMVQEHPEITFVAAHPGEYYSFLRHMARMKMSKNYYLDLSGYGIFRHGMLRHAIDEVGADRFMFGSDFPTCNLGMYIGGVLLDDSISDEEKRMIFSENAKRILKL